MTQEERKIRQNNLETSMANRLESLIRLCKTMWEEECMNRDCEECSIGRDKKELKEHFNIF